MKSKDLNLNKWQALLCSWIERFTTVEMAILPELIYKFNAMKTLFSQNLYRIKSKSTLEKKWKKMKRKGEMVKKGYLPYQIFKQTIIKTLWY